MKFRVGIILACVGYCSVAHSQPLDSPKQFYEKGYVVGDEHKSPTVAPSSSYPASSPAHGENLESISPETPETELTPSATESPHATPVSYAEGTGRRVRSVSLILAAHDAAHVNKFYGAFLDQAKELGLPTRDLFLVGDPKPFFASGGFSQFVKHPIQPTVRYFDSMPAPYTNVRESPTLVVETEEGVSLLEGYRSLRDFFNAQGEFVAPVIKEDPLSAP